MSSRRRDIALLGGSLLDLIVLPSTWRGNPLCVTQAPRGLAPHAVVTCTRCEGGGKVRDRFRRESECPDCAGAGRYALDSYTRERVGTAETPLVTRLKTATCDRCGGTGVWKQSACPTCEGSGRREWSPFVLRGVEDERRAEDDGTALLARPRHLALLYAQGHYEELERALDVLRQFNRPAARAWTARYVYGYEFVPDSEPAWVFLEMRMPEPVRVPRWVREAAERVPGGRLERVWGRHAPPGLRSARDREIRRLFSEGELDVAGLVRWTGLSRRQVTEIVYGGEGPASPSASGEACASV